MERTLGELEAVIRDRICSVCTDRAVDGGCGLEDPNTCALFRLFPQVAEAVQSVSSEDIRDYAGAIRENVCAICRDQTIDGDCAKRREVRCALDAYLLLIVDALEEATGRSLRRAGDHAPAPLTPMCV
jgi:hypothetical protein